MAVQRYDELHDGVIKCARWRDSDTFASCGNDRRICVVDTRLPPSSGGLGLGPVVGAGKTLPSVCGSPCHIATLLTSQLKP